MTHNFKVGDLAVIIKSNVGNIGKTVRIINDNYSEEGQTCDVVVESCNPDGLNYVATIVGDDGEPEHLTFQCMELELTSTKLQKLASLSATSST